MINSRDSGAYAVSAGTNSRFMTCINAAPCSASFGVKLL